MRYTLSIMVAAVLLAACDASPTAPAASPRTVTVYSPGITLSVPAIIYADEESGGCNIPLTITTANAPQPAVFDSGSLSAAWHKVEISGFWMRSMLGPIDAYGTRTAIVYDTDVFSGSVQHLPAPYDFNFALSWIAGGVKFWALFSGWCMPPVNRPPVSNPPAPPL